MVTYAVAVRNRGDHFGDDERRKMAQLLLSQTLPC